MMKRRIGLAWFLLAAGCVTTRQLQDWTSGQIGCSPEEIQISNRQTAKSPPTWEAICHGKKYYCSFGRYTGHCAIADTPASTAAPTTPESPAEKK